jgi:hypothetical protein
MEERDADSETECRGRRELPDAARARVLRGLRTATTHRGLVGVVTLVTRHEDPLSLINLMKQIKKLG